MMKRLLIVLAAVAVFAAGCANSSTSGVGASGSSSSAAPSEPVGRISGAPSADVSGAPSPGASGDSTKLTGTLEQGVEPNCVVLRATGRDHVLIFLDQQVRKQAKFGDTVTVVGQARPTQITTCQQGIPFVVSAMAVD